MAVKLKGETVEYVKLNPNAHIPTQGSKYAAGFDLYACIEKDTIINPGETVKIGTGLAITPPVGCFGAIAARSGLATKEGLRPANCLGIADFDYDGEYIVALHNDSNEVRTVINGERIAQLVFIPCHNFVEFKEVDSLAETDRGNGGFGSTGI